MSDFLKECNKKSLHLPIKDWLEFCAREEKRFPEIFFIREMNARFRAAMEFLKTAQETLNVLVDKLDEIRDFMEDHHERR